jgi:hypothetical protein
MIKKTRTQERNEATAATKKAAPKKAVAETPKAPKKDFVLFVSADEEVVTFPITVAGKRITPLWDNNREHLIWRVPTELAERFALHEFVVKGRIVREEK